MINDSKQLIDRINGGGQDFGLTMGAGGMREIPGNVTTDLLDHENVDISGDIFEVLGTLNDNSIASVYASHFIEHIDELDRLLREIVRVSRDGTKINLIAPHFSNAFFYSDVTHRKFFGLYTFCYLAEDQSGFRRKMPSYAQIPNLKHLNATLVFKSYKPYYIRHAFRKAIGFLVGLSTYTKELYEETGTGIISCYEIHYFLMVSK